MPLKLNTASNGSVTIDAANTASNFTLTVPAATGTTVIQNASNNLLMNSGYGSDAVAYGCRAWVNFNGTGTVAIRASGNVSSITDGGVGIYTVNFTTAMPDANYSASCMVQNLNTNGNRGAATGQIDDSVVPTTSAIKLWTAYGATASSDGSKDDCPYVLVTVFR